MYMEFLILFYLLLFFRVVKFLVKLMGKVLVRWVKCMIFYVMEIGKFERFVWFLCEIFKYVFDVKVRIIYLYYLFYIFSYINYGNVKL